MLNRIRLKYMCAKEKKKKKKTKLGSFKNVINNMCLDIIYLIFMYKKDLVLNNQQWLICHEIKLNQTNLISSMPQRLRTSNGFGRI